MRRGCLSEKSWLGVNRRKKKTNARHSCRCCYPVTCVSGDFYGYKFPACPTPAPPLDLDQPSSFPNLHIGQRLPARRHRRPCLHRSPPPRTTQTVRPTPARSCRRRRPACFPRVWLPPGAARQGDASIAKEGLVLGRLSCYSYGVYIGG